MILKTAANYNDEGGYIEAWKNSDGTTEVKLIPKSGGDEGKNGLRSISISPERTTTPALNSLVPIYYDDLTEDEKENGVNLEFTVNGFGTYHFEFTPTPTWYIADSDSIDFMDQGAPLSYDFHLPSPQDTESANIILANGNTQDTATKHFSINLFIHVTQ